MTTPALTDKDIVVLSSVVNRTGDTMFDDTLGEALGLQLRQSPFLNVVPDPRKALDVYRVWLAAYPTEYTALSNSALLLQQLGENDEALRNQEAATRVAPDQPTAWANLGDTYSANCFRRLLPLRNQRRIFLTGHCLLEIFTRPLDQLG